MENICNIHSNTIGKYIKENFGGEILDVSRAKLQQYSDPTAHYRMVREEVKQAAIDGKTKLQFPTGETAMKIEGLGDTTQWSFRDDMLYNHKLTPDKLKVGQEIQQGVRNELLQRNNLNNRGSWIITDVLGDGKFKAVSKDVAESFNPKNIELIKDKTSSGKEIYIVKNKQTGMPATFYDKNEAEKYIKEKLGKIPEQYKEQFDISGKVDTNNPIYKFYQETLGKYLKNRYGAKEITDSQGVKWFEVDIKPEMKDEPVLAFGYSTIENLVKTGAILGIGGLVASLVALKKDKGKTAQPEDKEALETIVEPKNDINKDIEEYVKTIKVVINENGANLGNTLAEENNNPGNLKFAGQPNAVEGRAGFAKFPTPEIGFRALIKQMQADQKRNFTLRQLITKYSPPSENDTEKYVKDVAKAMSITEDKKISELDPIELAKNIAKFESQTKIIE